MTVRVKSWRQIGTNVDVLVSDGDAEAVGALVEETIADADAAFSRFRSDSELSRVNASEGRPAHISELLTAAVGAALDAAEATDGLVDPSVGSAVRAAGYDRDFASLRSGAGEWAKPFRFVSVSGWRVVELDREARMLRIPRGVELDLDSVGKAFIVDIAARAASGLLPDAGGALISIGGDMRIVGRPPRGGWRVQLAEDSAAPSHPDAPIAIVHSGALATSSTTVRRWRRNGETLHHLIDPRSGRPCSGPWRTATVVAADCVTANSAATCAVVMGEGAPEWLEERLLPARLVAQDGTLAYTGGWPSDVPARTAVAA